MQEIYIGNNLWQEVMGCLIVCSYILYLYIIINWTEKKRDKLQKNIIFQLVSGHACPQERLFDKYILVYNIMCNT